ncbi:M20/M25/M40 family metallo-hydrolase [Phaeobacter sp. JH209B]|uniref:M20 family metallopeptidase n=1 Tax=Phaeobacter sp. JH209B TaxID=3112506 RepID=UPI003A8A8487
MTAHGPLITLLSQHLDRAVVNDLLARAVRAASVTGDEVAMVDMLRPEMERLSLSPSVEDFSPGRPNITGRREGGDGPDLLFIGHTDVVHPSNWSDHWAGKPQQDPFGATIIDGELWGRGAADLKAGICTSLAALDLLDRAGIRLLGTVSFAFVGDEESGEPGSGKSAGVRHWTESVLAGGLQRPDLAVYVEPTRLQILPVQIGFYIAEIVLTGQSAYFGRPELGRDALKAAHKVLQAIWDHSDRISAAGSHPLLGRSNILVTGLEAGGLIAVPGECRFSLIGKLLPGDDLDAATSELEAVIRAAIAEDIRVKIDFTAGRDHPLGGSPAGIEADHEMVRQLSASIAAVRPDRGAVEGAPFWSEMPFLTAKLGVPTVYCAPGDISICHTNHERVPLQDYHDGIVAFAAFIALTCGIRSD